MLGEHPATSIQSVINNYNTGALDADFEMRAFVFGLSGFEPSPNTTFTSVNGVLHFENAAMVPQNENFDFQSSNPYIQPINANVLEPIVDPYHIGRQISLTFGAADVAGWAADHGGTYYAADAANAPSTGISYASSADIATLAIDPYAYAAAAAHLAIDIASAVEYSRDGFNIIYCNNDGNTVDAGYPSALYYSSGSPSYYITGGGDDHITTLGTYGDIVYGGSGNDTVDATHTDYATVNGGLGDDLLFLGYGGQGNGDAGDDTFVLTADANVAGGDGNDTIFVEGAGYSTITADAGDDTIVFQPLLDISADDKEVSLSLGDGSDTVFFTADASFSFGDSSARVTILDGSADDHLYFNGYALNGGSTPCSRRSPAPRRSTETRPGSMIMASSMPRGASRPRSTSCCPT